MERLERAHPFGSEVEALVAEEETRWVEMLDSWFPDLWFSRELTLPGVERPAAVWCLAGEVKQDNLFGHGVV